ncbi:YhgE/Pip domain-containing protein [Streptomyces sp. NPDC090077]|uniref:YhgE/Pip domain-containing protein n=1 Tax=Streptomyces sp. NPDC090077 TaxID=3365938 RepID=UPI0038005A62
MRPTHLWKQPRGWAAVIVGGLLAALVTLAYIGPAADPQAHLRDLPLVLVNADEGAPAGGATVRLGRELTARIEQEARRDGRISWHTVDSPAEAHRLLERGEADGALVVPQDFSRKALSLVAPAGTPERPVLTVLTNEGAGSVASSMAEKAARATAAAASTALGGQLAERAAATHPGPDRLLLLQDPVHTVTQAGPTTSGATAGGAMTLYLTIALLLAGLLPAVLLTMTVDAALGYSPLEMGPRRSLRPVVRITRRSTFVAKAGIGAVTGFAAGSAVIAVAVWGLGVEPDQPLLLWLFAGLVCASVTLLTLALFAVFGMAGQVIALLVVTMFGIPLSGGTIPVQAQPGFARAVGELLPARHAAEGIRSLLFFDGLGSGLVRAWLVLGAYAAGAFLIGLLVTRLYDRRGFDRATPLELARHPQPATA